MEESAECDLEGVDDTEESWGVNVITLVVIYLTRPYWYKRWLY